MRLSESQQQCEKCGDIARGAATSPVGRGVVKGAGTSSTGRQRRQGGGDVTVTSVATIFQQNDAIAIML